MSRPFHRNLSPPVVLKFGGSVLVGAAALTEVAIEIYREVKKGARVVAVVSAFAGVTERLLRSAASRSAAPDPGSLAALLATGEMQAAARLTLELGAAGLEAKLLDPRQIGFLLEGPPLDSRPVALNGAELSKALQAFGVVVVPGFFGLQASGGPALLGRGGSDLTALFLAQQLGARECRLLKDVDGLYSRDPQKARHRSRFVTASWKDLLEFGGELVQPKAVEFAEEHRRAFTVSKPLARERTAVGDHPSRLAKESKRSIPLRVALIGLGRSRLSLYRRLLELGRQVLLVGVTPAAAEAGDLRSEIATELLIEDAEDLSDRAAEVLVDLGADRDGHRVLAVSPDEIDLNVILRLLEFPLCRRLADPGRAKEEVCQ